ncbi:hypothetical protein D3C86_1946320 [compost metagenome]
MGLIAQRRGNTPDDQIRVPTSQAGQRQLQLHTALIAKQFVPFINDHHAQGSERGLRVGAGEHQGQAFRGGNEGSWQSTSLARPFAVAGVAGAQADGPGNLQVV